MLILKYKDTCFIKKYCCLLISAILFAGNIFGGGPGLLNIEAAKTNEHVGNKKIATDLKAKVSQWMSKQKPLGFQENKGQMADDKGNLVPFVLYRAETPNLNIWITNTGLTYQFLKIEEEVSSGSPKWEEQNHTFEEKIKGEWRRVDMVLKNASIKKENIITENDITQGDINYFLGHCPNGVFNVKTYTKITIKEVYPGIDWVLYTSAHLADGGLKHDFIIHPHADPNQLKLIYEGSGKLNVEHNQIHFENELGKLTEGELLCYQGKESNSVSSIYSIKKNHSLVYSGAGNSLSTFSSRSGRLGGAVFSYEIGIETGNYNTNETLIIDPQLVWATFYGGTNSADGPEGIKVDGNGNVYVTGYTGSSNFPLQAWAGSYNQGVGGGGYDAFILRFTNAGVRSWATYYGGSEHDWGYSIAIDGGNNVYVTGETYSPNFPLQNLAGAYNDAALGGFADAFILRFSNSGVRTWATYYGGSSGEAGFSLAIDGGNNVYVTGTTSSANFPLQTWAGAYSQGIIGGSSDAFILRFSNFGVCSWATYYGGSFTDQGYSLGIDGGNNVYITGYTGSANFPLQIWSGAYNQGTNGGGGDAFILRFSNAGVCIWATYYGGSGVDNGYSLAIDGGNNVYVTGRTSGNFPLQTWTGAYNQGIIGGSYDAFILRFSNAGVRTWATYYGGSGDETFNTYENIAIDFCGNIFVSFKTTSSDIFTFGNAACEYYDASYNGGSGDIFLVKFSNAGTFVWATYFGGNGSDFREALALDNNGNLFVAGEWTGVTNSATYPVTDPGGGAYYSAAFNGGGDDGCIAKFIPVTPAYSQSQVNTIGCSPCNGSATISLTCSEPDYSYVWSNGSSVLTSTNATNTITGLCPGSYTVTATSNCNQIQIATFIITGTCSTLNAQFLAPCTKMCSGSCQSLEVSATGGTPPYNYNWTPNIGNGQGPYFACPLVSTQYTCLVTDANGATANPGCFITIFPGYSSLTANSTPATCGNNNGVAGATASGGTPDYSYTWSTGAIGATTIGLGAGTYTVTVKDANGCIKATTVAIISPPPLIGQFAKGAANCPGCGCKEWIMVTATGGTSPYSYLWPDGYVNRYKNQLCPGNYIINIKDKNGCSINVNLSVP